MKRAREPKETVQELNLKIGERLTMVFRKPDTFSLGDAHLKIQNDSYEAYSLESFHSVCLLGYTSEINIYGN